MSARRMAPSAHMARLDCRPSQASGLLQAPFRRWPHCVRDSQQGGASEWAQFRTKARWSGGLLCNQVPPAELYKKV